MCITSANGEYYAIGNVWTHEGDPLNEGILEGYEDECLLYESLFDIRTGDVLRPLPQDSEPVYNAKIDDNNIFIRKQK